MSAPARPIVLIVVGHYLPGFKAGGLISCVANIVSHLHREFEFRIITRDRDLGDDAPYPDIKPHTWQTIGNARVYFLSPGSESLSEVRRIVQETPHDLIYLNSFFEPLIVKVLFNRRLGRIGRTPILLTPQGEFDSASLCQKYPKKALFMRLARLIGLYAPVTWHASSADEADDMMKVMKIRRESIHIAHQLPPIVEKAKDDAPDAPSPVPARDADDVRVVFLSRISPEKNLNFALKVLSQVRTKVTFDIIGPIENTAYWNDCQQLLCGLPSHVTARSLGSIKSSEVMKTLSQYDLLIFPSGGESYGQVIAESLISGTQVLISTNTPWRNLEAKGLGWDLPLEDINSFVRVVDEVGSASENTRWQRRKMVKENMRQFLSDSTAVEDIRQLFKATISGIESRDGGLGR